MEHLTLHRRSDRREGKCFHVSPSKHRARSWTIISKNIPSFPRSAVDARSMRLARSRQIKAGGNGLINARLSILLDRTFECFAAFIVRQCVFHARSTFDHSSLRWNEFRLGRLPYNRIIENHVSPIDNTSFHVGQSEGKYVSAASSRYFRPYRTDEFTRHVWEYRYRIFTLKFFFTLLKLKYPIACLFFDRIRRSIWSRTRCKCCFDEKKNGTKRVTKSWEIFRTIVLYQINKVVSPKI